MNEDFLFKKIFHRLGHKISFFLFEYPRVLKYRALSTCPHVQGNARRYQPALIIGKGRVVFGKNVRLGVPRSPAYYSGYIYIDARNERSSILFGDNVWINNSCSFISEGEGIQIGSNTIMGINCEFIDSDFHEIDPAKRMRGRPKTEKVLIGENVFFGSHVKVMKGVHIGDNSVIANSAVVTKAIPSNVIAGGNPARVIRSIS